jgi:hypothetical protein
VNGNYEIALCNHATSIVAQPSRFRGGPAHRSFLAHDRDRGFSPPPLPSSVWLRRSILVSGRRAAGQGGARVDAWTKGNPWVVVGWKGAHFKSVSTTVGGRSVGNDDAGLVAGRGAQRTGRRVVECWGEAVGEVGGARGWLVRAIDGRRSVAGE